MKTKVIELEVSKEAMRLITALKEAGYIAYICGGWVRDALLGKVKKESWGMDVVTSATPNEIAKIANSIGYRARFVGKTFGVTVVNGFEVATFRTEKSYSDGRHPDFVEFGASPKKDAQRRDFTVNALFYDPFEKRVIDYVGGLDDLDAKRLRFIGDPIERLKEDRLRAIRYARFVGTLGDEWKDQISMDAIKGVAPSVVSTLAWERIADEILKMLLTPRPDVCMNTLKETNLLKDILPELEATYELSGGGFHNETVYEHSLLCARCGREFIDNPPYQNRPPYRQAMFVFACLIHDLGKAPAARQVAYCSKCERRNVPIIDVDAMIKCAKCGTAVEFDLAFYGHEQLGADIAKNISKRFKLSTKDTVYLVALVKNHMVTVAPDKVLRRCNRCEVEFTSWSSVAFELLPTDVQEEALACPECGSTDSELIKIIRKGTSLAPIRRLVVSLGKETAWDLVLLRWADTLSNLKGDERSKLSGYLFCAMYDKVIEEIESFKITDLAIGGDELIELGLKPGPIFKDILNHLKEMVLEDPNRNERSWLLAEAQRYIESKAKELNLMKNGSQKEDV